MSEQDESPVSRRQFFRGMGGGLFRAIGELSGLGQELSGLDKLVEPEPRVFNILEGDVFVSPEQQAASLSQIFGFLEQQKAPEPEAAGAEPQPEVETPETQQPEEPVAEPKQPDA